jgi:hypothetical protein
VEEGKKEVNALETAVTNLIDDDDDDNDDDDYDDDDDDNKPIWPTWAVGALFRGRCLMYSYQQWVFIHTPMSSISRDILVKVWKHL